jgi:hypothetical protein
VEPRRNFLIDSITGLTVFLSKAATDGLIGFKMSLFRKYFILGRSALLRVHDAWNVMVHLSLSAAVHLTFCTFWSVAVAKLSAKERL